MILPLFTYCSILTPSLTRTFEQKLSSFEKRASCIISRKPTENVVQSITSVNKKRLCTLTFQALNGELCENFKNYFSYTTSTQTRNSGYLLSLPKARTEAFRKSFKFMGARAFNELPLLIRKSGNTEQFKSLYK